MKNHIKILLLLGLVLSAALFVSGCLSADTNSKDSDVGMASFKSEKEMKSFIENLINSESRFSSSSQYSGKAMNDAMPAPEAPMAAAESAADSGMSGGGYSGTNVQIAGVDEADIIKTDGKTIYYTPGLSYTRNITLHNDEKYPYYTYDTYQMTLVINALPAETASIISKITDTGGNLYLADDLLITIGTGYKDSKIVAYDISNPSAPVTAWELEYDGYYTDSRLIDGKLVFVSQEYGFGIFPITYMGRELAYSDCYYPIGPSISRPNADVTYFVTQIDTKTGSVEDTAALISSYSSTIFVSGDNLYLTNYYYPDTQLMYLDFVQSNGSKYLPSDAMRYINKVMGYDLSDYIKYMAVSETINDYVNTLSDDKRTNFYDTFYEDYNAYSADLILKTEKTGITKVNLETFDVVSGSVSGRIDNKFFMDEKDGYLRVVSTVGDNWRTNESTLRSMVNVFDEEMKIVGTLDNIAANESVQTTRYVGNTLYLMTYNDADPFVLINLADPKNPAVSGELKLQGTYSYIYPISDNLLVGFGNTGDWRDWRTKLSLYDVSNPSSPVELDVFYFNPDEYAGFYDYHGFTWNAERNLMIVPGYNYAFVFEIKDGEITLMKADYHKDAYVSRSVYIGNSLYTFSDKEIHVYNMNNWQRVNVIPIEQPVYPDYGLIYPTHEEPIYATHDTPVYG
jgi:Secreted protein containing C-terminal beta-propeller domain distantly related to WD-40 repeats